VQGVCLSLVEIDVLTGQHTLLKTFIVHDAGCSINPAVDRGQIWGAFIQGYGWCALEDLTFDEAGRYRANTLSTYKIPSVRDLPETCDITFYEHECKRASIFGSKGVGEPPFLYGESVYFAIEDAVLAVSQHQKEVALEHPAIPESVLMAIEALRKF
jgi:xanthine dehydrogenase large subunit